MQGQLKKALSGFYYIQHEGNLYQTRARGNFRKRKVKPLVGDFVEFLFEERPLRLYRMPSSSRAYPLALEKKADVYRIMYQDLNML